MASDINLIGTSLPTVVYSILQAAVRRLPGPQRVGMEEAVAEHSWAADVRKGPVSIPAAANHMGATRSPSTCGCTDDSWNLVPRASLASSLCVNCAVSLLFSTCSDAYCLQIHVQLEEHR